MEKAKPRPTGGLDLINGTMPEWHRTVEQNPVADFIDYNLRGVGQVVFMNNPITGLLILAGMYVASPWLGVGGTIGLVVSTVTALLLGFDRGAIRNGLYGFNGVLVGAALATFLFGAWNPIVILYIVVISAFSTVLMAALSKVFLSAWNVPPFTLPFNFATLIFFFGALNWAQVQFVPSIQPRMPTVPAVIPSGFVGTLDTVVNAVLRGIGQLFFANSIWSGVLIIIGILVASRIAAGFALIGSTVGMLTGVALGADGDAIYNGLWGFNSFDAALAIGGVFFVLSFSSGLFAVACAIATALFFGAISAMFVPWGLPALTLPFCFGTLTFVLVKGLTGRLTPVPPEEVTTPEEHLHRPREQAATPPESAG